MNVVPSFAALTQAGLALDSLAWQRAADARARVALVGAAVDRAAGHEALASSQLNPWSRVVSRVTARRIELLRAIDNAAGGVDAEFAVAWYQARCAPGEPQFLRCLHALIAANGDSAAATSAAGVGNLALAWVVDPTDPGLAGVGWDALEPRASQSLRHADAGLPANLAHALTENAQDAPVGTVRVREVGAGYDEGMDVPNGELLLGRDGTVIALGVDGRVKLQGLAANAPLVRVAQPERRLWRLILKLVIGALPLFFVSLFALLTASSLHDGEDNPRLSRLVLVAFAAVSLGAASYALWRWWRRQFAVARWISRWNSAKWRKPARTRKEEPIAELSSAPSASPRPASPARLRGWRLALKRLVYPLTAIHLLGAAGIIPPRGALEFVLLLALIVHLAALPLWLIFCRRALRHWWWISSGAAALLLLVATS